MMDRLTIILFIVPVLISTYAVVVSEDAMWRTEDNSRSIAYTSYYIACKESGGINCTKKAMTHALDVADTMERIRFE